MELVRAENPESIQVSIPGAVVERDATFVSQETEQLVIGVSAVSFILGGVALFLSFAFKKSSE